MAHIYFLSYANADLGVGADRDKLLERFFQDLRREVTMRGGVPSDAVDFLDRLQPTGTRWARNISDALASCAVLVPIFSPNYFASAFCGQEWEAFSQRLAAHESATGGRPNAVLPVWWLPIRGGIPAAAAELQNTKEQFGEEYRQRGLRYLMQRKATRDRYQNFLVDFTEQVLRAAGDPPDALRWT